MGDRLLRLIYLVMAMVVCVAVPFQNYAQNLDVIVGTGTGTTNVTPLNNYYKHSWTECIYKGVDIDESGTIYKIAWECSNSGSFEMSTFKIYMGTTSHTHHYSNTDWLPLSDLTLVYSGTNITMPNSTGWHSVTLSTPFPYSQEDNLVIVVSKTTSSYSSTPKYYYSGGSDAVLYRRSDSNTGYAQHPGTNSGSLSSSLANVRLYMYPMPCPSPQNVTISGITATSATVTWNAGTTSTSWEVGYGMSAEAAQANTTIVQTNSFQLSELDPETEYYVSIRALCDTGTHSYWKNRRFKTGCSGTMVSGGCFDLTNLSNPGITCYYGTFYNPYNHTGIISNRHKVITTLTYDNNTDYMLPTIPDCKDYAIRLGNDNTGAEAESIVIDHLVDSTNADLLLLQYAVVMEDPGHTADNQPRFTLEILNSAGQVIDPLCGYEDFIASSGLGWNTSSSGVIWNEWTTVGMDISAYHGQLVKVRLTTRDCEQSGHFGYAYFLLDCGSRSMKSNFCGEDTVRTFMAPAGFRYEWFWESNPDSIISTSRSVTFTESHTDRIFCRVISMKKDSCYFLIYGTLEPRYPIANFTTTVNACTRTCQFQNQSLVSEDGITPNGFNEPCENALWDFGDGTTSNQMNPTHVYSAPGTYQVTLVSGLHNFGCTDTAHYTVYLPNYSNQVDTFGCSMVVINNQQYTSTGNYVQHLTSSSGCDSVVTYHVTIYSPVSSEVSVVACDSYSWQGETYTQSGDYVRTLQTVHGCDSILTLHLTIGQSKTTEFYDTICGGTYQWNSMTYSETGDYIQHLETVLGCDSTVTLHLLVAHDTAMSFSETACESFVWNDVTYTETGNYNQYFQTSLGCDSVVTLNLIVGYPQTTSIEDTVCAGNTYSRYNFIIPSSMTSGLDYFESEQLATTIYGCDSTVYLHLMVYDTSLTIISQGNDFCENSFDVLMVETDFPDYVWNTGETSSIITVTEPGTYSVTAFYNQCSASTSFKIPPCDIHIFVPNAITPARNEGLNDFFSISSVDFPKIQEFSVSIMDRWGSQVYYSTDKYFRWNGEVNGVIAHDVVYNYLIRYSNEKGKRFVIIGTVVVL